MTPRCWSTATRTRWCADDGEAGHWWRVDLGKPEDLTGCRILWEADAAYGI